MWYRFFDLKDFSKDLAKDVHPSFLELVESFLELSGVAFSEGFLINPLYSQLLLLNDESYITCR